MNKFQQLTLLFLRLALGWIFLYAGMTKILDPNWSAAGFLKSAQTLPWLFSWFAGPQNIGWVNFSNEWGQTLVGLALISGVFIRIAAPSGILLMILYYLPTLNFPYVGKGTTSFIVDQHFIFILVFLLLLAFDAGPLKARLAESGKNWSLGPLIKKFLPKSLQNIV